MRIPPPGIHEVSQGVLGAACNLIKAAIVGAVEAGRDHLAQDDFITATDRYFVGLGLYHRNPFREHHGEPLARAG